MSLNMNSQPSAGKKDFGRIEDGTYGARVCNIIDLGLQHISDFSTQKPQYHVLDENGKWLKDGNDFVFTTEENDAPDLKPLVLFVFEFPTEKIDIDGEQRPRWMTKEYPISPSENSGLFKLMKALAPGGSDVAVLLGKACFIQVGSTSSGKAKVVSVSQPMKGIEVGPTENDQVVFDLDTSSPEDYSNLAKWLQNRISSGVNFDESKWVVPESKVVEETPVKEDSLPPEGDKDDIPY